jgi:haloalkane dehalogenase
MAPHRLPAPFLPDWLESQLPFQRYMIEISEGLRFHVMEQGSGTPVVMFHGNPTWGFLYRKVAAELREDPFRLIMPDLMGLGFSDRVPAGRFNLREHIGWARELFEKLELEHAILAVQDWGGPIGIGAVSRGQVDVAGLLVMNTVVGPPTPGFRPTAFHRVLGNRVVGSVAGYFGVVERNMARAQADPESISSEAKNAYLYPLDRGGNDAVIDFVRMVPDSMHHPSVEPLREVGSFVGSHRGPAAIVWGRHDPVLGRLLRRVSRALPHAEVTETDAGHFLQEEVPAEIASAIRSLAA